MSEEVLRMGLSLAGLPFEVTVRGPVPHHLVEARFGSFRAEVSEGVTPWSVELLAEPGWRPERPPDAEYPAPEVVHLPDGRVRFLRRTDDLHYDREARRAYGRAGSVPRAWDEPGAEATPLETPLRLLMAYELPRHEGLLLHGSGYADDRGAVLFLAVSGGGKTTTVRKLPHEHVLSDDQVAVRREGGAWRAYALPFVGRYRRAIRARSGPLRAVVLLGKGPRVELSRVPAALALARLMRCVVYFVRGDPATEGLFSLATDLVERVPVYSLVTTLEAPMEPVLDRLMP